MGSYFALSHPLRGPIVRAIGEGASKAAYSAVAAATLIWLVLAYRFAPVTTLLWPVGDALSGAVTVVMLLAAIRLMGSLIRNPASPTSGAPATLPDMARGVFAITRHPMMWTVALWRLCHVAVYPMAKNIIVALSMIIPSLVGAALQDRKKERLQPDL